MRSAIRTVEKRWETRSVTRPSDAPSRAGDAFYGLSHLAAECMAKRYGDQELFTFVRLVLARDNELDQAARDAAIARIAAELDLSLQPGSGAPRLVRGEHHRVADREAALLRADLVLVVPGARDTLGAAP